MKMCMNCGNEIESGASECPHCEAPQLSRPSDPPRSSHRAVVTVNLEEGHPLVAEALAHMDRKLRDARIQGTKVVRLIHGYGSSGVGGAIKVAVRKRLKAARGGGTIKNYVGGEDYEHAEVGRKLRARVAQLKASLRTDQRNPGITLVEL